MEVIVYTTTSCQYCKMIKEYLEKMDVEYIEKNVSIDEKARGELISKGFMGVPITLIDGKVVQGFNKQKIDKLLRG